jgi:hypothetical protein
VILIVLEVFVGSEVTSHKRRFCEYGSDLLTISLGRTSMRSPRLSAALTATAPKDRIGKTNAITIEIMFMRAKQIAKREKFFLTWLFEPITEYVIRYNIN